MVSIDWRRGLELGQLPHCLSGLRHSDCTSDFHFHFCFRNHLLFSHWVVSRLFCDLMDYIVHQAPLSMGFPSQEYWSGLPFPSPGDLADPGIEPPSSALAGGFFTTKPPRKAYPGVHKHSHRGWWGIFIIYYFQNSLGLVSISHSFCRLNSFSWSSRLYPKLLNSDLPTNTQGVWVWFPFEM